MESEESITKNQRTVEALRQAFVHMAERLTPEVEPAAVYRVRISGRECDEDARKEE